LTGTDNQSCRSISTIMTNSKRTEGFRKDPTRTARFASATSFAPKNRALLLIMVCGLAASSARVNAAQQAGSLSIVGASRAQIGKILRYDPGCRALDYPHGDVPIEPANLPYIVIVSDRTNATGRPLFIHNIGQGVQEEDRFMPTRR
jgi:uncharacterized protein YijF (DUF1287 family)